MENNRKCGKKKKLHFPLSLLCREVKDVKIEKKNYIVRGVMGCQTVRRWEGKMKSRGEERGEDTKMFSP